MGSLIDRLNSNFYCGNGKDVDRSVRLAMAIQLSTLRHDLIDKPQKFTLRFITMAVGPLIRRLKFEFSIKRCGNGKDVDRSMRLAMAIHFSTLRHDLVDKPQKYTLRFITITMGSLIRRLKTESLRHWQGC